MTTGDLDLPLTKKQHDRGLDPFVVEGRTAVDVHTTDHGTRRHLSHDCNYFFLFEGKVLLWQTSVATHPHDFVIATCV